MSKSYWEYKVYGPNYTRVYTSKKRALEVLAELDDRYLKWGNVHKIKRRKITQGNWGQIG